MSKSLYYENKIVSKIETLSSKYNCSLQLVDKLQANACIINYDNKFIIFVSEKLERKLLPLTLLHEFGHIYFKTFRHNPKKYNYFIELLSNLYAIRKLSFCFPLHKRIVLRLLSIISEEKLYVYYKKHTQIGGNIIYEQIFKNQ